MFSANLIIILMLACIFHAPLLRAIDNLVVYLKVPWPTDVQATAFWEFSAARQAYKHTQAKALVTLTKVAMFYRRLLHYCDQKLTHFKTLHMHCRSI